MKSTLSQEEQDLLLDLAFRIVKATAEGIEPAPVDLNQLPERLSEPAATFVTLSLDGALRGCIGTTQIQQALALDVLQRACAAASLDPRFPAISPQELPELEIEISVLTPPKPLHFNNPKGLLSALQAEKGGVIIKHGLKRATFLPQVWERVPDPQDFLELLCQKASLHREAWCSGEIQVETYEVESFHRKPAG